MKKTFDNCNWAVCYDIAACTQDDHIAGRTVCAWFADPNAAQDFIDLCMPKANRDRFYIIHRNDINTPVTND